MKKILLLVVGFVGLNAFGQVEIRKGTDPANIAGTEITYDIDLNEVPAGEEFTYSDRLKLYVRNTGSTDRDVVIVREEVDVPTGWKDNICWPPTCFNITAGTTIYTTPGGPNLNTLLAGADKDSVVVGGGTQKFVAEIKPQFFPGLGNPGESALYKYSVKDVETSDILGSVNVRVNYINNVSINTVKSVDFSVAPNPATDVISINAEGVVGGTLRVVDMLGNVIYVSDFNNSKKVNVSEFKNGVYFLTVQSGNSKGFTKKLVVRH